MITIAAQPRLDEETPVAARKALYCAVLALVIAVVCAGACSPEPKGAPVSLPEGTPADAASQARAWRKVRSGLLGTEHIKQIWPVAGGIPDTSRLPEALYVENKIIEIDRKCLAEQTEECLTDFDRAAVKTGIPGAYTMLRSRELCDDLSIKAEILLAMDDPKAALQAAGESLERGEHPYNLKNKGDAHFALGEHDKALAAYQQIAAGQRGAVVATMIGLCQHELGRSDDARATLTQAFAKQPSLRADVPGAAAAAKTLGI